MEQVEEVLARGKKLYEEKQDVELLSLLSDEKLSALEDARLYKLKGLALRRTWGLWPERKKALKEAIRVFTIAIQLNRNEPSLYSERGTAWRQLGYPKKGLRDHTTAVSMNPKNPAFHRARALSRRDLRQFKAGMSDIATAIDLNPRDPESYITRSDLWTGLKKFKQAKKDLSTAIRLSPRNARAYYRLSWLWGRWGNRANEIRCFITALKWDEYATADQFVDLGDLYYSRKQYDLAFKQYDTALDMDPGVYLYEVDHTLVNIFNVLASVKPTQRKRIYKACIPISDLLIDVRDSTDPRYRDDYRKLGGAVVHFTKLSVGDILLSNDDNKFRFYHVSYMNDPEEGKILLQILNDPIIEESYNNGGLNEESNFYLGSFLPESHADELVMWRTYGKDEHDSEGKGCCVLISREFFEEKTESIQPTPKKQAGLKADENRGNRQPRTRYDTTLHKVIYYNKSKNEILHDDNGNIRKQLMKLRTQLNNLIFGFKEFGPKAEGTPVNRAIDSIVYYVITELRYYFKSSDYSYENEERVILFVPPKSPLVKIEEGNTLPRRLYVEAQNPIRKHVKKIVLGPRVVHPDRWSYLKVKMVKDKNEIEIVKSGCKFQ